MTIFEQLADGLKDVPVYDSRRVALEGRGIRRVGTLRSAASLMASECYRRVARLSPYYSKPSRHDDETDAWLNPELRLCGAVIRQACFDLFSPRNARVNRKGKSTAGTWVVEGAEMQAWDTARAFLLEEGTNYADAFDTYCDLLKISPRKARGIVRHYVERIPCAKLWN